MLVNAILRQIKYGSRRNKTGQSTDALTLYGLFTDCEDGGSCLTEHGEKLSTSITYYFLPWSVIMNARTFLSP